MTDIELAKEKLNEEGCTFAAVKDGEIISSEKRGILPLVEIYEAGRDLEGYSCADKVCGKAPASLYICMRARNVYSRVMTEKALSMLEDAGIDCAYDTLADRIINREGTDICPMEKAVKDAEDPETAVRLLLQKIHGSL